VWDGSPLKNVGFQMKKGAIPHLVNMENKNNENTIPKEYISL